MAIQGQGLPMQQPEAVYGGAGGPQFPVYGMHYPYYQYPHAQGGVIGEDNQQPVQGGGVPCQMPYYLFDPQTNQQCLYNRLDYTGEVQPPPYMDIPERKHIYKETEVKKPFEGEKLHHACHHKLLNVYRKSDKSVTFLFPINNSRTP